VGKAADWLREERRKVLGDWVAFCLSCGAAQRWFEEFEAEVPEDCAQCGGPIRRRCPSCSAAFSSMFAIECEACGAALRDPELFGTPIRRSDVRRESGKSGSR
jgi:hypothetical protein